MPQAEWEKRLAQCEELLDLLESLPSAADDFAASASETIESIADWIDENEYVSPAQCVAIDNIQTGAESWQR